MSKAAIEENLLKTAIQTSSSVNQISKVAKISRVEEANQRIRTRSWFGAVKDFLL